VIAVYPESSKMPLINALQPGLPRSGSRGTESSNPSRSSGESIANLFEPEDVG
jgi:hypothetical protein